MRRLSILVLAVALAGALAGCSGGRTDPKLSKVTGKITVNGQAPAAGMKVVLTPGDATKSDILIEYQPEGGFTIEANPGPNKTVLTIHEPFYGDFNAPNVEGVKDVPITAGQPLNLDF